MKTYLAQKCTDDFYGINETLYVGESLEQAKRACYLGGLDSYYVHIEEWDIGVNTGIGTLNLMNVHARDLYEEIMNIPIVSLK